MSSTCKLTLKLVIQRARCHCIGAALTTNPPHFDKLLAALRSAKTPDLRPVERWLQPHRDRLRVRCSQEHVLARGAPRIQPPTSGSRSRRSSLNTGVPRSVSDGSNWNASLCSAKNAFTSTTTRISKRGALPILTCVATKSVVNVMAASGARVGREHQWISQAMLPQKI